ncbi:MAG: ubiE2 [Verrucomicrobiales bacterium]|jgi:hypothetical protein|nr:ubiE2 [Verrucomicrobiales bacterium]
MLLTLTSMHRPATDLGYLLRKNPARAQTFELTFGLAHVFYSEASEERFTEITHERLHYDRLPPVQKARLKLLHGSLIYRDQRLGGFDAAAVVEVIEHLTRHAWKRLRGCSLSAPNRNAS